MRWLLLPCCSPRAARCSGGGLPRQPLQRNTRRGYQPHVLTRAHPELTLMSPAAWSSQPPSTNSPCHRGCPATPTPCARVVHVAPPFHPAATTAHSTSWRRPPLWTTNARGSSQSGCCSLPRRFATAQVARAAVPAAAVERGLRPREYPRHPSATA